MHMPGVSLRQMWWIYLVDKILYTCFLWLLKQRSIASDSPQSPRYAHEKRRIDIWTEGSLDYGTKKLDYERKR